jgi:hypothetical protein
MPWSHGHSPGQRIPAEHGTLGDGTPRQNEIRTTAFCDVTMSTSCGAGLSKAQLPSGLWAATPRNVPVPVKLPVASVNCPVLGNRHL